MQRVEVHVGNAMSRLEAVRPEIMKLLRYELAYPAGEPGFVTKMNADGTVDKRWWDGYRRMLDYKGRLPSGLVPRVLRLLRKWSVGFEVRDHRERPAERVPLWRFKDGFELRDYQRTDCESAERWGRGVIDSPPRTGKTVMMAELLRRTSCLTVITSPTRPIAEQTHARLLDLLRDWSGQVDDISGDFCLLFGQPKSNKKQRALRRAHVVLTTAATAAAMPQSFWDKVECLIVDERHHQAAKTYHKISRLAVNAYYRWGFTGTNFRSNPGEQVALEVCLGRVVAQHGVEEMIQRGVLVRGHVEFWPVDGRGLRTAKYARARSEGIVTSAQRNELAAMAATDLVRRDRRVLVLVHELDHGERLRALIPNSEFVQGKDGDEVRRAVARLDSGELRCLIGSPVVGEGLDCPSADALVYAKGLKAKVTHVQDMFRVLTGGEGKKEAIIVDFADRFNKHAIEHSAQRLHNYCAMGLQVSVRQDLDKRQLTL